MDGAPGRPEAARRIRGLSGTPRESRPISRNSGSAGHLGRTAALALGIALAPALLDPGEAFAAKKPAAEVVAGVPAANKPELDLAKVAKTLAKGAPGLRACFAPELAAEPGAAGVALLTVRLDDFGEVMASILAGPVVASKTAPLAVCVRDKVAAWKVAGVKIAGLAFRVALTFGAADLKKKGPLRAAAAARTIADPLPPAGSIAPAAVDDSAGSGEAPEGYVLPAAVISASGGGDDEWVLDPVDVGAEPDPPPPPPPDPTPPPASVPAAPSGPVRKGKVEITNVRAGAGLDKLEVNEVVKGRLRELDACWAKAVATDAALKGGDLILSIHVATAADKKYGGRGKVFSAAAVTRDIGEAALACIESAVGYWLFPAPSGAPKSVVTATFKFSVLPVK